MKAYYFLITLVLLSACANNPFDKSCDEADFHDALISSNVDLAKPIIDGLVNDLSPNLDQDDSFGHQENLSTLIERMNNLCGDLSASEICYACIYTLPAQSEILVELDSVGVQIRRVLDISTPEDGLLELVGMHL